VNYAIIVQYMNFIFANKNLAKIVLILTTISFVWLGTFGLLNHMTGMKSDNQMNMGSCLFNGQEEICNMDFSEHISVWQSMVTSLPQNFGLLDILLLAIVLVVIIPFIHDPLSRLSEKIRFRYKLYIRQHPQISLFNFIQEIFSQGILNPKLFVRVV